MIKYTMKQAIDANCRMATNLGILTDDMIVRTVTYENNEVLVYKFSDLVWSMGGALACATTYKPIISFMSSNYSAICVDEYFETIPTEVQNFILYHEFGHIMYGHLDLVKSSKIYSFLRHFKLSKYETEADMFSAKFNGISNAIESLEWLYKNTNISKRELKKRIKVLKSKRITA